MRAIGIDVSTYQDSSQTPQRIDWSKPKLYDVKFVINRASIDIFTDQDFIYNWEQERLQGYLRSPYGFWDYRTGSQSAKTQAQYFANILKSTGYGEIPCVWMDFEQPNSTWPSLPSRSANLYAIEVYMKTVEDALGVECGLYTRPSHIKFNLSLWSGTTCTIPVPDWLRAKKLWVAAWPTPPAGESLEHYIERTHWEPYLYGQWEDWFIWQYGTPAEGIQMGMETKDVDKNYFNGTYEELLAICGQGDTMTDYKTNAIGLYTSDATWTNTGYNFIVAHAGDSWHVPNPNFKPIEEKARTFNVPFFGKYKFNPDFYVRNQYPMNDALWPPPEKDEQLQMFIRAFTSRNVNGVIIELMDAVDHDGNLCAPNYYEFAAKRFVERAYDWARINKPNAVFFIASSNSWIETFAPDVNNWVGKYDSYVDQASALPLDKSYPNQSSKPFHLDNRLTWEMWEYTNYLVIFNGPNDELRGIFGFPNGNESSSVSKSPSQSPSQSVSFSASPSLSPSASASPSFPVEEHVSRAEFEELKKFVYEHTHTTNKPG